MHDGIYALLQYFPSRISKNTTWRYRKVLETTVMGLVWVLDTTTTVMGLVRLQGVH